MNKSVETLSAWINLKYKMFNEKSNLKYDVYSISFKYIFKYTKRVFIVYDGTHIVKVQK